MNSSTFSALIFPASGSIARGRVYSKQNPWFYKAVGTTKQTRLHPSQRLTQLKMKTLESVLQEVSRKEPALSCSPLTLVSFVFSLPPEGKGYLTTLLSTSPPLGSHSLAFFLGILVACFWGFLVTVIVRAGTRYSGHTTELDIS